MSEVIVCRDLGDLSRKAAQEFVRLAHQSVAERGRFAVALSGGSTPKSLYALLATPEFNTQISWPQVHLFWGDERCVPPDHPESNYRMVQETLLSKVPIPAGNVYRMEGEKDPEVAASEYERVLKGFFEPSEGRGPRFDLILLGIGEDGHTASLFPGSDALRETGLWVAAPYVDHLKAYRLTLTLPVLNHGANIIFLVAGKNKADILDAVLREEKGPHSLPARLVQPMSGRLVWLVEENASTSGPYLLGR